MTKRINYLILIAVLTLGFTMSMSSCGDEPDTLPEKIFGTITFENIEDWPTWVDSGDVLVSLFPAFSLDPLAGWGEVPDGAFGPGIPGGTFAVGAPYNSQNPIILNFEAGKTQYDYEVEVDPGVYSAMTVGFVHSSITDPNKRSASLGVHFGSENEVSHGIVIKADFGGGNIMTLFDYPAPIAITVEEGEQKEINFKADFGFVNTWFQ